MSLIHSVVNLVSPHSDNTSTRRREYILNILSLGSFCLALILFLDSLINYLISSNYQGNHPIVTFLAAIFFGSIWLFSRRGYINLASYVFVSVFMLAATQPLLKWGILLPQGILTYGLVIVMAGVLIGSAAALYTTLIAGVILLTLTCLSQLGVINFDMGWAMEAGGYNDVAAYFVTFLAIALVSWLSNREIEMSLKRAAESEQALLAERNNLEIKVRQRTEQLEQAQLAKMLELHRFAEFGRLTATLLHEIANPLSAVSLNLEVLEGSTKSNVLTQIRQGISHMESYIQATRRQLQHESEITTFDVCEEIQSMVGLLKSRAKANQVRIKTDLAAKLKIKGDHIRFDHLMSNLIANAIDAYHKSAAKPRVVMVSARKVEDQVMITVADHGVGISSKDLSRIFEPFFTKKLKQRGTGIGLNIVKQIVENELKGSITVTSTRATGTTFTVTLPAASQ